MFKNCWDWYWMLLEDLRIYYILDKRCRICLTDPPGRRRRTNFSFQVVNRAKIWFMSLIDQVLWSLWCWCISFFNSTQKTLIITQVQSFWNSMSQSKSDQINTSSESSEACGGLCLSQHKQKEASGEVLHFTTLKIWITASVLHKHRWKSLMAFLSDWRYVQVFGCITFRQSVEEGITLVIVWYYEFILRTSVTQWKCCFSFKCSVSWHKHHYHYHCIVTSLPETFDTIWLSCIPVFLLVTVVQENDTAEPVKSDPGKTEWNKGWEWETEMRFLIHTETPVVNENISRELNNDNEWSQKQMSIVCCSLLPQNN